MCIFQIFHGFIWVSKSSIILTLFQAHTCVTYTHTHTHTRMLRTIALRKSFDKDLSTDSEHWFTKTRLRDFQTCYLESMGNRSYSNTTPNQRDGALSSRHGLAANYGAVNLRLMQTRIGASFDIIYSTYLPPPRKWRTEAQREPMHWLTSEQINKRQDSNLRLHKIIFSLNLSPMRFKITA